MRRILPLMILLLTSVTMTAAKVKYPGERCYIFRYTLRDKADTTYSLAWSGASGRDWP